MGWKVLTFAGRGARALVSLLCLALFLVSISKATDSLPLWTLFPIAVAGLGVSFLIAGTFMHELGHAAAAWLIGWRVHAIAVWGVCYRPRARRFERVSIKDSDDYLGWVTSTPPLGGDWVKRRAIVILGGVAGNLVLIALCFALGAALPPVARPMLIGLALTSLAQAIENLVPRWRANGRGNDGARLLDHLRGKRPSAADCDRAWLDGHVLDDLDSRLWDRALVARLETAAFDAERGAWRDAMLLSRYLSLGQVERAHALLERSDAAKDGKHAGLVIERAFLVAIVERDAAKASALLALTPERVWGGYFNYWRARAAVHGLRGEVEEAREAARRARALAAKGKARPDGDDVALLEACERGEEPPLPFGRAA